MEYSTSSGSDWAWRCSAKNQVYNEDVLLDFLFRILTTFPNQFDLREQV